MRRIAIITMLMVLFGGFILAYKTPTLGVNIKEGEIVWRILNAEKKPLAKCRFILGTIEEGKGAISASNADGIVRVPIKQIPIKEDFEVRVFGFGPCFVKETYGPLSTLEQLAPDKFVIIFDCSKATK